MIHRWRRTFRWPGLSRRHRRLDEFVRELVFVEEDEEISGFHVLKAISQIRKATMIPPQDVSDNRMATEIQETFLRALQRTEKRRGGK